jgi:Leucine-rich repeat (LRR) protein
MVTELNFWTDSVADISPVRALVGLKTLGLGYSGRRPGESKLSDLSPLKGMQLTQLFCFGTQTSDLSPLKGMQLTTLFCTGTQVSDLSPLRGMPLTLLTLRGTRVSDLSPLTSMSTLGSLTVNGTKVTPASIAALQTALPNCKIEWDGVPSASPAGEDARPKTPGPAASGSK